MGLSRCIRDATALLTARRHRQIHCSLEQAATSAASFGVAPWPVEFSSEARNATEKRRTVYVHHRRGPVRTRRFYGNVHTSPRPRRRRECAVEEASGLLRTTTCCQTCCRLSVVHVATSSWPGVVRHASPSDLAGRGGSLKRHTRPLRSDDCGVHSPHPIDITVNLRSTGRADGR